MSRHKANRAEVLTAFLRDTAEHKMEVVLDQGLHRHLKFRKPGTGCYGFDIVTWPGYLAISGDMGAAMFTRLPDMLEFFRDKPDRHDAGGGLYINCGYWAEKCVANDGEKKEFDTDLFRECVKARFDEYVEEHTEEGEAPPAWAAELWEEIEQDVLLTTEDHESTFFAIKNMDEFKPDGAEYEGFRFSDAWESSNSLEDYRFHFIWRLYAIAYAVRAYDETKAVAEKIKKHGIVSLAHQWLPAPFWPMDAQNPLAKAVLKCSICGALKVIGHPMPAPCIPKLEAENSGFSNDKLQLQQIVDHAQFHLNAGLDPAPVVSA